MRDAFHSFLLNISYDNIMIDFVLFAFIVNHNVFARSGMKYNILLNAICWCFCSIIRNCLPSMGPRSCHTTHKLNAYIYKIFRIKTDWRRHMLYMSWTFMFLLRVFLLLFFFNTVVLFSLFALFKMSFVVTVTFIFVFHLMCSCTDICIFHTV